MPASVPAPLSRFRRLHWQRRFALPVFVTMFFAAGLAHAVHVHKPETASATVAQHCGLCLQFDRIAGAPVVIAHAPAATPCLGILLAPTAVPICPPATSSYLARGPPAV
ncbi:MAG: hypothetical protein ABIT36_10190 [Steroidobacteraceae bacterium]